MTRLSNNRGIKMMNNTMKIGKIVVEARLRKVNKSTELKPAEGNCSVGFFLRSNPCNCP